VNINLERLVREYRMGFGQFKPLYRTIFPDEVFDALEKTAGMDVQSFSLPIDVWVKTLYEMAAVYHHWKINRVRLINLMVPLYYGRVASFVNDTRDMSSSQAEEVVEEQAEAFEEKKDYLIQRWDEKTAEPEFFDM